MFTDTTPIAKAFPPVTADQWRAVVEADLKGAPFEKKLITHTYEGIDVKPLYSMADWPGQSDPSGFAGLFPRTRGGLPLGTLTCGWDIRQERAEPDPASLNERLLDDLAHGVTSVLLRLDVAGRRGLDPDTPEAGALSATDGAMLATLDDFERVFNGVHVEMIGIALEAGASALAAGAMIAALFQHRGLTLQKAWFAFNADPLAVLARDGVLPGSLDDFYTDLADLARWSRASCPRATTVRVGTAPYHHAGATAAQDLAFSMATGVEYLRELTARGLSLEDACSQLLFSYAVGCNFFLAASKLRAARRLWSRVVEASGGTDEAQRMRLHVRTSKRVLTTRDPWVNMLRNTSCCFAAGLAHADSVTTPPHDAALGHPSPLAARIARNTQIILQEETHLHRVVDPAGGSWFVETLTDELCDKAWPIFQEIERQGGMGECLKSGWVHEQIDSAFLPRARNIATRKDPILGVSEFANVAEQLPAPASYNIESVRAEGRLRLAEHRLSRSDSGVGTSLKGLREASGVERFLAAVEAARAGATLAEIARVRAHAEPSHLDQPIAPHAYAEPFERLREASDMFLESTGARPRVYLANVGKPAQFNARAGFSRNFFEAGGFEVIAGSGSTGVDELARAFAESGAPIAVICSTDQLYEEHVPVLAGKLHQSGARRVVLAGFPGANEQPYRDAGVDRFIYIKCDVVSTLTELLRDEGVLP